MIHTFRDNILPEFTKRNLHRQAERFRAGNVLNIYFHGVSFNDTGHRRHMAFHQFRGLMTYLVNAYQFMPLKFCQQYQPKKTITISFDDGYKNLIENAIPLLYDWGIPATIFACPGIGRIPSDPTDHNFDMMSHEDVKWVSDLGFDIGSHTMTHKSIPTLSDGQKMVEMDQSRKLLQQITGQRIDMFCFPYAQWDINSLELAKRAGYKMLFGQENNGVLIPRFCISNTTTTEVLKAQISKAFINYAI